MTKFSAILTTAALVVGFIPFGKAVCQDGEVAIGDKFEYQTGEYYRTYGIFTNDCTEIANSFNICGNYNGASVECVNNVPSTVWVGGSAFPNCYASSEKCWDEAVDVYYCCAR